MYDSARAMSVRLPLPSTVTLLAREVEYSSSLLAGEPLTSAVHLVASGAPAAPLNSSDQLSVQPASDSVVAKPVDGPSWNVCEPETLVALETSVEFVPPPPVAVTKVPVE